MQSVRIHALTPLLFRDSRPFGANAGESRATSLMLPPPSAVAGLLRTFIGDQQGWDWGKEGVVEAAKAIRILHHHLERRTAERAVVIVPAPRTAVLHAGEGVVTPSVMRLNPAAATEGSGHDAPAGMLPLAVSADVKPLPGYLLWTWNDLEKWLLGRNVFPERVEEPPPDERVQIAVDPRRGAADDGMLFTAQYRSWDQGDNSEFGEHTQWSLVASIEGAPTLSTDPHVAHFGGERRPVVITPETSTPIQPGPDLRSALTTSTKVTLQLLTPGVFDGGWRPGWVDDPATLHPALAGATLASAAVGRPETVSGWSYELARRGPKATRWASAAGSTYFFQLARPLTEQDVNDLWLTSVSDQDLDRSDGYGVAVWGVWN